MIRAFEPYIRLMRPPNLVTAAADILAGYAAAGLAGREVPASLLSGSMALYAGGVVLNDYFDRRLDAQERPERPIPSGKVRPAGAALLGFALLASGMAACVVSSWRAGVLAGALACCIVFYNTVAKHHAIAGPVCMGTCRGLNLLLGLGANPAALGQKWALALIPAVYIAAVTMVSAGEVKGSSRKTMQVALALVISVYFGIALLGFDPDFSWPRALPVVALLAFGGLPPLWQAYRQPTAGNIMQAVKRGVLFLIVLDAALAMGYAGFFYGTAVLALLVLAAALAHLFAVT